MNINKKKRKGFSLVAAMMLLIVVSVTMVATSPFMLQKSDQKTNTSKYVQDCIIKEGAANLNSQACTGAIIGCKKGVKKDCNTLFYYAENSTGTQKQNTYKVLKNVCEQNGQNACRFLMDKCAESSANCTIKDTDENDVNINHYFKSEYTADNGKKDYIKALGIQYYRQGITDFNEELDDLCDYERDYYKTMDSAACKILGSKKKTATLNFDATTESLFYQEDSRNGTIFTNGVVKLIPTDTICNSSSISVGTTCGDDTKYAGQMADGRYLFTTPSDAGSNIAWNNGSYTNSSGYDSLAANSDKGRYDTIDNYELLTNPDGSNPESPYQAVELCKTLNESALNYGHTDWYLPALNELKILAINKLSIGGFVLDNDYWSSTQFYDPSYTDSAYSVFFEDGVPFDEGLHVDNNYKYDSYNVRCIRSVDEYGPYFVTTTNLNNIQDIELISSVSIEETSSEPTSKVRWLVSFDGKDYDDESKVWEKLTNACTFSTVATGYSELDAYDFQEDDAANTKTQIQSWLANCKLSGSVSSLDFAMDLYSQDGSTLPEVSNIEVEYYTVTGGS